MARTFLLNWDHLRELDIQEFKNAYPFSLEKTPSHRLHKLKGNRKNEWSVTIKLPWCITFEFKDGKFINVKIENYHEG